MVLRSRVELYEKDRNSQSQTSVESLYMYMVYLACKAAANQRN